MITSSIAEGTVLWAVGHQAQVLVGDKVLSAAVPGRWRLESKGKRPVAAGDRVELQFDAECWRIVDVLPRQSEFTRRMAGPRPLPQTIAANLDVVVIVASVKDPVTPFRLIDRLLVTAILGDIPERILVVNKTDLVSPSGLGGWCENYRYAFDSILFTSCVTGQEIPQLGRLIHNRTALFAGSSGVGKSTLANYIDPHLRLRTSAVSDSTRKGRHITSIARLYPLRTGGWVTDTPGLRECAPWNLTTANIGATFPEIARLADGCHFRNCLHKDEFACHVKSAIGTDHLPAKRYESYLKLLQEAKTNEQSVWK